ncbi:hypothetical protein [Buchananella hordeovulneris]|uniref:hypothetical protein n=1 Tax=Buchananella hordeovulneris TaxID=52770 RepID=UPI0026DAF1DD|nr:hypothetical protein [Buchananella hordeovulneris]MDO5081240.1 hypothetical protein [Buchananella hordeovulneris]
MTEVVEDKLRATVSQEGIPLDVANRIGKCRYYDRILQLEDGTWVGVEIKSGDARLSKGQNAFDDYVSQGNPSTVKLRDGRVIKITRVMVQEVD